MFDARSVTLFAVLILGFAALGTNSIVCMREITVWRQQTGESSIRVWLKTKAGKRRGRITILLSWSWVFCVYMLSFWVF